MHSINIFIELFAAELPRTKSIDLTPETIFRDLDDWSSLSLLSILEMIEEEFGVSIRGFDLREAKSINDLYLLVQKRTLE